MSFFTEMQSWTYILATQNKGQIRNCCKSTPRLEEHSKYTKGFYKDSSIYLSAALISTAISFITLPIFTRYLSPADYGVFALLLFNLLSNSYIFYNCMFYYLLDFNDERSYDIQILF